MPKKLRLDQLLVGRGLFPSREQARRAILAGKISVATRIADKPSELLDEQTAIAVKPGRRYVSRGALKLEPALEYFHIDLRGKTALDIGASTGGFTDCMLQRGAEKVYAVDVGYGQLDWKLRSDPRVTVFEKTNARFLTRDQVPKLVDLCVIDVSFISLALILPNAIALSGPRASHRLLVQRVEGNEYGKQLTAEIDWQTSDPQVAVADRADQVAVRVTHVTADLGASVLRFGKELRSDCSPLLIGSCDVRDADVEECAGALRVGRSLQGYVGLVLGRAAADIEDDPRVGDLHDHRVSLKYRLGAEHLLVPSPRPILICDHQEVG